MRILFGIQGTGNGHISRGRMMARHFNARNIDVDYLFSGRDADKFFDMEIFGDYQYRHGLTFYSENGKVSYPKTILSNNIFQFIRDAKNLELGKYDLVMSDFEPVTAWAARLKGVKTLGIGHQYAFGHRIPRAGENALANWTMKLFAPTNDSIGLHWDSFGNDILPPIIDTSIQHIHDENYPDNKIVVYLPFENQRFVQSLLEDIEGFHFYIYSPELVDTDKGRLHLRKTNHDGFKHDLASASGVISNSGFELISECLHLGLQILTRPQAAQMEQQSNAAALEQLGYATTTSALTTNIIRQWLNTIQPVDPITYPDVAAAIVDWIADWNADGLVDNDKRPLSQLGAQLWQATLNHRTHRPIEQAP